MQVFSLTEVPQKCNPIRMGKIKKVHAKVCNVLSVLAVTIMLFFATCNLILSIFVGHFGSVYKAFLTFPDVKGDQMVAVKTLHRKL